MNKKRVWRGGLVIAVVVFLAYTLFTSIPFTVSKSYEESIYNRANQVVKRVPVSVSGEVYRGIFKTNEFIGNVTIDGKAYSISTFRSRRSFAGTQNPYPYVAAVGATNSENFTVTVASIMMSRDFNSIVASTDAISQKYGKGSELTGLAAHTASK